MAPILHLSDLCQKSEITPILDFLRHRVRGPSTAMKATSSTSVPSNSHTDPSHMEGDEGSSIAAIQETPIVRERRSNDSLVGEQYVDLLAYEDSDGRTALHWAIAMRNYTLVSTLLGAPYHAPVLTWDRSGCTPFFTSCMVGANLEVVKRLLEQSVEEYPSVWKFLEANTAAAAVGTKTAGDPVGHGAGDGNRNPASSSSILSEGQPGIDPRSSEMKSDDDEGESGGGQQWKTWDRCPLKRLDPSELQACQKEVSKLKTFITALIVNAEDHTGSTPLHIATSRGNEPLLTFLLENGGDFTAQNRLGQTPLHRAVSKSAFPLVEKLILYSEAFFGKENKSKHVKFVNVPDKKGDTALFYASMENDEEIGCYLLQHGSNRDHKNKKGQFFYEV